MLSMGLHLASESTPIPGTSKLQHLDQNAAALDLVISDNEFREVDDLGREVYASSVERR